MRLCSKCKKPFVLYDVKVRKDELPTECQSCAERLLRIRIFDSNGYDVRAP